MLSPAARATYNREKLTLVGKNVTEGAAPVDRVAFYRMVGHPELAAKQQDAQSRQVWFIAGGIAVGAAAIAGGIVLSNSNDATLTYTDPRLCQIPAPAIPAGCSINTHTWQTTTGVILAVVGAIAGGVLVTLGFEAGKPVTTPDQDRELAAQYNQALLRRLAGQSKSPSGVPELGLGVGPEGGMVSARWDF